VHRPRQGTMPAVIGAGRASERSEVSSCFELASASIVGIGDAYPDSGGLI